MPNIKIHSKATGPFFQFGNRPIAEATADLVKDLIREGEAKVEAQLYPGHGVATGEYKRSIHGTIVKSALGIVDIGPDRNAIVGKFLELGRYWPSTGHRFRGLFFFRKATQHLRRIANEVAGRHYKRAIKRLT